MRRLSLVLDALPVLRDTAGVADCDLMAAAILAELAGVSAVRVGLSEELRPVTELDVMNLRRTVQCLELRMPASQGLLKVALEARPDRVILASDAWEGNSDARPIDPRHIDSGAASVIRSLDEAGIPVAALILPEIEAVKAAHSLGVGGVEFFTGAIVDLPDAERRAELERLGDAARIASKLRLNGISVAGSLGFTSALEILAAAPVADRITVGRSVVARSLLVGIDRAVRDFRQLLSQ